MTGVGAEQVMWPQLLCRILQLMLDKGRLVELVQPLQAAARVYRVESAMSFVTVHKLKQVCCRTLGFQFRPAQGLHGPSQA